MKKKFYIVWNQARNEGFITDEMEDAEFVATGDQSGFGVPTAGEAFREAYADGPDDDLYIQEVMIEVRK